VKKCRHPRGEWGDCPCQWYADYRVAGQRTYKPLGRDRAQAQAAYRLVLAELAVGVSGFAPGASFTTVKDAYLANCRQRIRPQSVDRYETFLNIHAAGFFGAGAAEAITTADLAQFAQGMLEAGYARSHVRTVLNVTIAALRHAAELGVIKNVPARPSILASTIDDEPEVEVLTLAEAYAVIGKLREPEASMSTLALWTGMRASEILALTAADVGDGTLEVVRTQVQNRKTKDGKVVTNRPKSRRGRRTVDLISEAVAALEAMTLPVDSKYQRWLQRWQGACKKARVPTTGIHALRHTNVSLRFAAGQTATYIADQVGDSPATIMRHYAHLLRAQTPPQADLLARLASGGSGAGRM
jgi:integrase